MLMILFWLAGCQPNPIANETTLVCVDAAVDTACLAPAQAAATAVLPTQPVNIPVTRVLRSIPTNANSPIPPTAPAPLMTATLIQTPLAMLTAVNTPTIPPLPSPFPTSTVLISTNAVSMNAVVYDSFVFGQSVFGRPMIAHRFDRGGLILMLVGGIHGGWEVNTVDLMNELIAHFQATPGDVLSGMTLIIIPSLNPDGAARGRRLEGRFNDHGVDLNRNWGCDWQDTAYFQQREVNPGTQALSEPETRALASLILQVRPATVLFFHSAANGIFAGDCNGGDAGSEAMAAVYGTAAGYSFGDEFTSYLVTGTAPNWVVAQGIPSADVELSTWRNSEFERNLRGVMALQCWLAEQRLLARVC